MILREGSRILREACFKSRKAFVIPNRVCMNLSEAIFNQREAAAAPWNVIREMQTVKRKQ